MARAGDILKQLFSNLDMATAERYAGFFSAWTSLVGQDLASHCRLVDLRNGALLVEGDHPGWLQMLQLKQEAILAAIVARYPELGVRTIQYRLVREGMWTRESLSGRAEATGAPAQAHTPASETDSSEPSPPPPEASAPGALSSIKDPALRASLEALRKDLDARARPSKTGGRGPGSKRNRS